MAKIEFVATLQKEEMKIDVAITEIQDDGTRDEIISGSLLNEAAVLGINDLASVKLLLLEANRGG